MTELEAVNIMLSAIGQVPVAAISSSPLSDSAIALAVLQEYTFELQSRGYDFNTTENVEMTPDGSGFVTFDDTYIKVKAYFSYQRFLLRQSNFRLYDLINKTDVFTTNPHVTYVVKVPFTELPVTLQRYVLIRAARVFANRVVGSQEQNNYNAEDEARARAEWLTEVAVESELNVMSSRSHLRPRTFSPNDTLSRYF